MSERYRPSKLKRARIEQLARGETPAEPPRRDAAFRIRITLCRHDVHWLECAICSKPRTAP